MNIKFEKEQHIIEIILNDEPQIRKELGLGNFTYKYIIKSFTIDGEDMGKDDDDVKYFLYDFKWVYRGDEKVFCLKLEYDLAKKVSVKFGRKEMDNVNLILDDDIIKVFKDKLIPRAEALIEEAKKKQIKEIEEADKNVSDNESVTISVSGRDYSVVIGNIDFYSFLRKEIEEKLNIYNNRDIFEKFPYEIGLGYSTDYHMTYKELKELIASIDDEVKVKKAEIDRKEKAEAEAKAKREAERERYNNSYEVIKNVKLIYPRGGEGGTDGYYRVIIKEKATGEEFDVVLRNVFDAGCWALIHDKDFDATLTDSEKSACKWVYDHAPFTTSIRM